MLDFRKRIKAAVSHIMRIDNGDFSPIWASGKAERLALPIARALADYHDIASPNIEALTPFYSDFIGRLMSQFEALTLYGFTIEPLADESPSINSSRLIFERLDDSGRLSFFKTSQGFNNSLEDTSKHPLLKPAGFSINGYALVYNDILRVVHDLLGHYHVRSNFRPLGEYRAFLSHLQLFEVESPAAIALMLETIIQSSWFETGKHIRRLDGSIPKPADLDYVRLADRPFAKQKIYLPYIKPAQLLPAGFKNIGE